MAIQPRRAMPAEPRIESGRAGIPAHGALLAGAFDYQAHLALVRRREVHKTFSYSVDVAETSPIGEDQDLRIVLPSTPGTQHIFIAIGYQFSPYPENASDSTALGDPIVGRIDATLYNHDTSALIDDPGCQWDFAAGTLPSTARVSGFQPQRGEVSDLSVFDTVYESGLVHTSHRIRDSAVAISRPRCLAVPSGSRGANLRVRLETTNARVLYALVRARFEPEV